MSLVNNILVSNIYIYKLIHIVVYSLGLYLLMYKAQIIIIEYILFDYINQNTKCYN